ncbi:hypothetical protein GGR56DRAFT_679605 [Xylariaceae sp. FL0804]|nr:hypothetical protein GGR56DRAFT_679605 [Xylariaceae sp. FL0804]
MPPKADSNATDGAAGTDAQVDNGVLLTPGDTKILDTIFRAAPAQAKPSVDWQQIAGDLGYKNVKVAKDRFAQICGKYNPDGTTKDATPKTPRKRATPAGKKVKKEASDDDDNDMTPSAKKRKTPTSEGQKATKGTKAARKAKTTEGDQPVKKDPEDGAKEDIQEEIKEEIKVEVHNDEKVNEDA